jgi:hypothetical protein
VAQFGSGTGVRLQHPRGKKEAGSVVQEGERGSGSVRYFCYEHNALKLIGISGIEG